MQRGHISKLFPEKKYGLIKAAGGEDVHFHENCLWDIPFAELTEGQEIEFEMQPAYNGFLGFHIRPYRKEDLLCQSDQGGKGCQR